MSTQKQRRERTEIAAAYTVKTRHAEHGFAPPDHLESIIDDPQQI